MRVHTIPQNVTSYEDKIVGALIGRQFIYLAIGGVIVFILLTTDVGPMPIRIFFSFIIGALAAAMALLKINERGFDTWALSFLKAVLGPTEWVWIQQELVMSFLIEADAAVPAKPVQPTTEAEISQNNRERLHQFEHFLDQQHSTMDADEKAFVSGLNFGEMVPQAAFQAAKSQQSPPPMLTPQNHQRPSQAPPQKLLKPEVFNPHQPKPLAPLASTSTGTEFTFLVDGKRQSIQLLSNQRINRSLSRQLLSGGTLPLPVRGELQITIPNDLKQELTTLIGYAPATAVSSANESLSLVTAAKIAATSLQPTPAQPSLPQASVSFSAAKPTQDRPAPVAQPIKVDEPDKSALTPPAPLQPAPAPVPAEPTLSDAPPTVTYKKEAGSLSDNEPGPSAQHANQDTLSQLSQAEAQAREAIKAIDSEEQASSLVDPLPVAEPSLNTSHSLAQPNDQTVSPSAAQPAPQPANQVSDGSNQSHSIFGELKNSLSALQIGGGQSQPAQESMATQPQAQTTDNQLLSLRPILNPGHTDLSTAVTATTSQATMVPLTSEKNVVNGIVLDASGQFLPGVVVVVKDGQGDPKRALKTNKLGQFVITTPLPNGTFMVEVDKKGLSFDIIKVDLNGSVLPALEIRAKAV